MPWLHARHVSRCEANLSAACLLGGANRGIAVCWLMGVHPLSGRIDGFGESRMPMSSRPYALCLGAKQGEEANTAFHEVMDD